MFHWFKTLIISITIAHFALFFVSCKQDSVEQKSEQGTILLLLGSNIAYWNQIQKGAELEAANSNLKIQAVYRESDSSNEPLLNAIKNIKEIANLKAIIVGAGDSTLEQFLADSRTTLPIIAVDQKPHDYSPLMQIIKSSVIVDNIKIAKEISSRIKEEEVVCISYYIGGSIDRNNAFVSSSGKTVHSLLANDEANAFELLQQFVQEHKKDKFAIFFATGSFINKQTIDLLKGHPIYTMDMNAEIEKYIRNKKIEFTVIPNTFDMGSKAIKTIFNPNALPNQYVSVLYVNSRNIDSTEVSSFLK